MSEGNNDNKKNNQENDELENEYLDDEIQEENNNVEENSENSAKEVAEAVKTGTSLAKNAASGNVLGAAKDAIKLAKNKKLRKKVIINAIMNVLIPFIIIIFLGACILGIFNAVGDAIKGIAEGIGDFFAVDSTDGSIVIDSNQISEIITEIEDLGVSVEDLKLLGDYTENATEQEKQAALEKYIRKFYEAQAVTETLNYYHKDSTENKTYGAIYVYRANEGDTNGTNRRELHYIKYEDMKKKQESGDSSALDSFSIDDSGNLVIAGKTQVIKESGSSESALHENSNVTTITLRNIDYKSATSKYTTQMNFLIYLTMVSQNPEFVAALTDLIKDTRIEITVMDNVSTYVDLQTYKYDLNTKTKHEYEDENGHIHTYYTTYKQSGVTEITKETTITTNPSINITYVKTWFCEQTITYNKQQDGPITNMNVNNMADESEPSGEGTWKTNQSNTIQDTTTNIKYVEGTRGNVTFILGEYGDAERYKNGQISEPTFIGLMETKFRIPYSTREEEAGSNLISGAEILFYLLQQDSDLENMELIMRYALYLYSGKDYGVTSLDGSIFEIQDFNTVSNRSLDLAKYLRQFSHSGEAPQSSDGKYYLMYGDGVGWPTIGNADIQWKSHYSKFSVPGKVLENGIEKDVSDVSVYVNSKLGKGPTSEYTNEEISSLQIYIEKELVDSIGENIVSTYYNATQQYTAGLNLSRQQLYALTTINYNFGKFPIRNGKTFVQVYQEGAALYEENSWQHNRYIWDNWWSAIGGGSAGHIPARDAAFETYVKGVYDFNSSSAGTVFGRKYYIYYTNSQLAQYDYAPDKPITRTSSNEEEIFTYVAGLGGNLLEVADQLHQSQVNWSYSVGGDLFWNDIEMSINNPNQVTCCATYVSSSLYLAGYFTEDEMNNFNYNSSNSLYNFLLSVGWQTIQNYNDLQPGDVVFMDNTGNKSGINHVQLYAGDGLWYNAGNNDAIHGSAPYSQGSWASSSFLVALRQN